MHPAWFIEGGEARRSYRLGSELMIRFYPSEQCWLVVFRVPGAEPVYREEWLEGDLDAMHEAADRAEAIANEWASAQPLRMSVVEERELPRKADRS